MLTGVQLEMLFEQIFHVWERSVPETELDACYVDNVTNLSAVGLEQLALYHATPPGLITSVAPDLTAILEVFPTLGERRRDILGMAAMFRFVRTIKARVMTPIEVIAYVVGCLPDCELEAATRDAELIYISPASGRSAD